MFSLGDVIGGKYCLEEEVGEGGMATIWRAVHMDLDRPVAVKFLRAIVGPKGQEVRDRFLREARVAASVRHRNVVDIIDFGTTDDGQPYMVMELLEGQTLADRLFEGPPLHVAEFITLIGAALKGLQAVHDAGIVHRDLKPENIFLMRDSDGTVYPKLLDFGISRVDRSVPTTVCSSVPTIEGLIVGTPHYMSPEQARGLRDIDHRTDIYSMGVILYEGLTGELPFDSENPGDLVVMVTTGVAKPMSSHRPDLGQPLSDVIERAMARDRSARYQSAVEMRDALLDAAERTAALATGWGGATARSRSENSSVPGPTAEAPLGAPGMPPGYPTPTPTPRRGKAVWVTAGAAAIGAAIGIGILTQNGGASETPPRAPEPVVRSAAVEPEEAEASSEVTVRLRGIPEGAEVRVGDRVVEGSEVVLAGDGRTHVIEVRAEGFEPWRIGHPATADGEYEVELEPLPVTEAPEGVAVHSKRRGRRITPAAANPDGLGGDDGDAGRGDSLHRSRFLTRALHGLDTGSARAVPL